MALKSVYALKAFAKEIGAAWAPVILCILRRRKNLTEQSKCRCLGPETVSSFPFPLSQKRRRKARRNLSEKYQLKEPLQVCWDVVKS